MKTTERQSLGSAPIGQLLRTFAIPSIISMVVSTLYNIVDQIFIGRGVGYLGNGVFFQAIGRPVRIPVLLTGGVTTLAQARALLEEGSADLIGVGRAIFRDPHWAD